jgi:hypothetical protein
MTVHDGIAHDVISSKGRAGFMPLRGRDLSQAELQAIKDAEYLEITVSDEGQELTISD